MARVPKVKKGNTAVGIGYVRMSTDDQKLSPDVQERAIKDWAARTGVEVMEIHRDLGKSGSLKPARRPGLMAALGAVQRLGAGTLVVAKRDRLGRHVANTVVFEALLNRNGARVVSCAGEGTETDDPSAKMLRGIIDVMAEYERLIIAARTTAAMAELKRKGKRAGQIPYGWALGPDGSTLIQDRIEQKVIGAARACRRRNPTWSYNQIGVYLRKNGFYPRNAVQCWDPTQVRRILLVPEEVGYNPREDR